MIITFLLGILGVAQKFAKINACWTQLIVGLIKVLLYHCKGVVLSLFIVVKIPCDQCQNIHRE